MNLTQEQIKEHKVELAFQRKHLLAMRKELNDPNTRFMEKDIRQSIKTAELLVNQIEIFLQYS